jgi:hypothetical protein
MPTPLLEEPMAGTSSLRILGWVIVVGTLALLAGYTFEMWGP